MISNGRVKSYLVIDESQRIRTKAEREGGIIRGWRHLELEGFDPCANESLLFVDCCTLAEE